MKAIVERIAGWLAVVADAMFVSQESVSAARTQSVLINASAILHAKDVAVDAKKRGLAIAEKRASVNAAAA